MADNNNNIEQDKSGSRRGGVLRLIGGKALWIALLFTVVALVAVWFKVVRGSEDPTSGLATFIAKRGPLTISILESGTIKAKKSSSRTRLKEGLPLFLSSPRGRMLRKETS